MENLKFVLVTGPIRSGLFLFLATTAVFAISSCISDVPLDLEVKPMVVVIGELNPDEKSWISIQRYSRQQGQVQEVSDIEGCSIVIINKETGDSSSFIKPIAGAYRIIDSGFIKLACSYSITIEFPDGNISSVDVSMPIDEGEFVSEYIGDEYAGVLNIQYVNRENGIIGQNGHEAIRDKTFTELICPRASKDYRLKLSVYESSSGPFLAASAENEQGIIDPNYIGSTLGDQFREDHIFGRIHGVVYANYSVQIIDESPSAICIGSIRTQTGDSVHRNSIARIALSYKSSKTIDYRSRTVNDYCLSHNELNSLVFECGDKLPKETIQVYFIVHTIDGSRFVTEKMNLFLGEPGQELDLVLL